MPLSFTADLHAELLTPDGRLPLVLTRDLAGECGEILEVSLPDGTLNLQVLLLREWQVTSLLVTSDKAVQVCVGDPALNQAWMLQPGGIVALLDSAVPAAHACTLSYAPGDGSVATCLILVAADEARLLGCTRFAAHPTLSQQLMHCWDLDESTGTRMDHVGDCPLLEGAGIPTSSTAGKLDQAAVFTGSNWLAAGPDTPVPFFVPPFTLALWMWIDAFPVGTNWTMVGQGNTLFAGSYSLYLIVREDNHRIEMSVRAGFSGVVDWPTPVSLGAWHLVIGWHTSLVPEDSGRAYLQVDNGTPVSAPGSAPGPLMSELTLGAVGHHLLGNSRFVGRLDTVMFWSRVLTDIERAELWNSGKG